MVGSNMNALFGGKAVPPPDQTGVPRTRPGRRLAIRQALDLQELCYATAFAEGTKPMERAQLARAWVVLEEQKRILRGRLKPGSINASMMREPPSRTARRGMIVDVASVVAQLKRQELAEASVG